MGYADIFKNAKTPKVKDLKGEFTVKLAVPYLPQIQFAGHQKVFPTNVSTKGGGINQFLGGLIKLGNFRIQPGPSELGDGLNVMKILYNHPDNPFFLKLLTDEIREVKPGYYLGRGILDIFGKKMNSFYFTVTKES